MADRNSLLGRSRPSERLSSTTVADGRLECWAVLKIATSSYGQRLCSQ